MDRRTLLGMGAVAAAAPAGIAAEMLGGLTHLADTLEGKGWPKESRPDLPPIYGYKEIEIARWLPGKVKKAANIYLLDGAFSNGSISFSGRAFLNPDLFYVASANHKYQDVLRGEVDLIYNLTFDADGLLQIDLVKRINGVTRFDISECPETVTEKDWTREANNRLNAIYDNLPNTDWAALRLRMGKIFGGVIPQFC